MYTKRLAVIGSRTLCKTQQLQIGEKVKELFQLLDSQWLIISGGASTGGDYWAKRLATQQYRPYSEFVPAWKNPDGTLDRYAGLRRNSFIAKDCTHLVAFWDGKSHGTLDTIRKVQELGKPVWVVQI